MDTYQNLDGLSFTKKLVNGKYPVAVPSFNDKHDWFSNWETARFDSMEKHLKPGMVLYDVGAYDGWQSVILSDFIGARNIVLIEPVEQNWANIKATWEFNNGSMMEPKATFMGFLGPADKSGAWCENLQMELEPPVNKREWPVGPDYSRLIDVTKFKLMNEHGHNTACLRLDSLAEIIGPPDAVNIDVEGAALLVLYGAEKTFLTKKPLVWISVHPDFMRHRFGIEPDAVHRRMEMYGYDGIHLGTDHEEHHFYTPKG